ncbi:MAG: tetratricopeptide repeat protein [Blastocatellia bacterium]
MFFYRHSIYFCHSSLSRWREAFLPAFLLSCACALALAQPTASAPPLSLQPEQSVTLPLRVTEVNTFHLHLAANEFVHLEVKKQDAARQTAWGANLFRPDQQTTFLLQKNTTRDDPQGEVKMVTEQAGQHRLVIHWGGQSAPDARFTLTVRAWRQATEADRKLIQTVKAEGKIYLRYDEQTAAALQDVTQQAPPVAAALEGFGEWGLAGKVNYYLGLTYHDLGEYRQALACYQRAQALQQRANDKHEEAVAVVSMGEAYQKQSRFQEALDAYTHSIQLWDQAPPRKVAGLRGWPLLNIASVYVSLGETELARNYLQQAAANYELDSLTERERNRGRAGIQARLGHLQSLAGNWESAITYYEQAVALMKRYEGSTFYGRYYARLGEAYAAVGKSQLAEDTLKEGVRIWQGVNDPYMQAGALTSLGKFYLQQKDFEAAARCLQQALAFQQSLQDRRGQAETLYQLSQMERARQAIPQAANYIAQAVGLIEDVRVGLTDTELRTSFLATVQDYYALQLDLLMHLHQQAPQAGYELAAWQVSERAKARGLLDVLYESRTDIRNGVAPNLLAHEQELRQTINEKSGWLTQLLRQRESAQQTETVRNELKLLRAEYEQALARIRAASPRYAALTHPQPVSLADLQHALDADSVLLEFALGDQQSYLWVISPQAVQSYALPARAQIEATARRAYDALTAHMRRRANETLWQQEARLAQADRAYAQEAATLSQLLFSKLPAPLKARRLLVADGALHYLPFAALPALTNATTTTAHRATQHFTTPRLSERPRFLLEEYEIVQLPSATTLCRVARSRKTTRSGNERNRHLC